MAKNPDLSDIDRLKQCINNLFEALVDQCREDFEEYEIDTEIFDFLLYKYSVAITGVSEALEDAKKPDLRLIEGLRTYAVICFLEWLCNTATTLHKAGAIPHKDDIFQRKLVKLLDRKLFQLDALFRKKYKWLTSPDVAYYLQVRNHLLGDGHLNEWK